MPLDLQKLGGIVQGIGRLLENPDEYARFKAKLVGVSKQAALKLAHEGGMPPDVLARLKKDLGIED